MNLRAWCCRVVRLVACPGAAMLLAGAASVLKAEAADMQTNCDLVFCCKAENDLFRVVSAMGLKFPREESPAAAVKSAADGAGVLVLADGYPNQPTDVTPDVFAAAAARKLRLFVEFPARLPDLETGKPRRANLERGVVTAPDFGEALPPLSILMIHDCHFVETKADKPLVVVAKVAGFDTAVYGLDNTPSHPLLFEHPRGDILVCTTKFSQFVTARYATKDAWQAVWRRIVAWLQPGKTLPTLEWTPAVRPTYTANAALPAGAQAQALIRGIDWHSSARMLIGASWKDEYDKRRQRGGQILPVPEPALPPGDGEHGLLEGVFSRVDYTGRQPASWWLRSDSNGETSLAFALRSKLDGDARSARIASNLLDWIYFNSHLFLDDPAKPNYGLICWAPDSPRMMFQDNDVKIMLGCMGSAALQQTDRWDERLLINILANFRTTGPLGFRGELLDNGDILKHGWEHFWRLRRTRLSPHFEAWTWAVYLWLYDKTRFEPLLERTKTGLRMMMRTYPDDWYWTNGIQQERGRMLLTLAWLLRIEDTPEHRAWLMRIADDLLEDQVACGAIREELGTPGKGCMAPPKSNEDYGTHEASLIQKNGDPVADMLYTCNFAFLGLHEAAAVTGDARLRAAEDKLAEFLVRIQVRSEARPELDGAWFRAFDYTKWDYWGSNADSGWGAWAVECGWTQAWIPAVMALRELKLNLWDLTKDSKIARHMARVRPQMLPDAELTATGTANVKHDAVGKQAVSFTKPDARYPGLGAGGLTDGALLSSDFQDCWLGYYGQDFEAVVDLGKSMPIRTVGAVFLQSVAVGIFLPPRVEFALSDDGKDFRAVGQAAPDLPEREAGPVCWALVKGELNATGRYVRVCAANVGKIPAWHAKAPGAPAWLFVDEILVNPVNLRENKVPK